MMFGLSKSEKIKRDLETRWPDAKFRVTIRSGDISIEFLGGNNHVDDYPTHEDAIAEMEKVIRKTLPGFMWTDYQNSDGKTVLRF